MSETASQLSGTMFLFERPELLNAQLHGDFGLNPVDRPFDFCAKIRAAPLTVSEIPLAAQHYPVIFSGEKDAVPLAVLGVIDDVNLYVDDDGRWDGESYIPGYLRRYPFAFASEAGGDRFAIVIDAAFAGIVKDPEQRFFDLEGKPTEQTQSAIDFCTQYEQDRLRTQKFMEVLEQFNLVTGQSAQFTPVGQTEAVSFAQYYGVDETRLNALSDPQYLELRKTGALALIYAQILSMTRWRFTLVRRARRFNLSDDQLLKPRQLS